MKHREFMYTMIAFSTPTNSVNFNQAFQIKVIIYFGCYQTNWIWVTSDDISKLFIVHRITDWDKIEIVERKWKKVL